MIDCRFHPTTTPLVAPRDGYKNSPFRVNQSTMLNDLEKELEHVEASNICVHVDMPREHIRNDGWPRADARAASPGIMVTFDSKHGPMVYEFNAYNSWQANLRAFGLTLEALRAVDRYGGDSGKQYAGWAALPAGALERREQTNKNDLADLASVLLKYAGREANGALVSKVIRDPAYLRDIHREAAKRTHPDAPSGTEAAFRAVNDAHSAIRRSQNS